MKIAQYIMNMDQKALRSVIVLLGLFAIVALLLIASRNLLHPNEEDVAKVLNSLSGSALALPITIAVFLGLSFLGIPQWILIGVAVAAFGSAIGGTYAWIATLTSASVHFILARFFGAAYLQKISKGGVKRIVKMLQGNAVLTSFVVRLVPTGPFIIVNFAAGLSGMRYLSFLFGTAFGVMPKIVVIGLLAQGVFSADEGKRYMALFVLAALMMIGIMLVSRQYLRRYVSKP